MSANRGGDMAHTVILPTLAHSSSNCWWYFFTNLMNLHLPTSSPNLSRFWLMRGLILTSEALRSHFVTSTQMLRLSGPSAKLHLGRGPLITCGRRNLDILLLIWKEVQLQPERSCPQMSINNELSNAKGRVDSCLL